MLVERGVVSARHVGNGIEHYLEAAWAAAGAAVEAGPVDTTFTGIACRSKLYLRNLVSQLEL